MSSDGLDSEIQVLAGLLGNIDVRGQATVFGACGLALSPLLNVVEELSGQRWVFPSVEPALRLIEEFAIGLTGAADHSGIRAALMAEIPHGDDLDSPWSTYAQDALICVDAGLAAASINDHPMPIWIQYGLEPLSTSLQLRDEDLVRSRGEEYWRREVVFDPDMAKAIAFLRRVAGELSERADVSRSEYLRMSTEASVLRPGPFPIL